MEAVLLASGAVGLLAVLIALVLSTLRAVRQSEIRAHHRGVPPQAESDSDDAAA